MRRLTLLACMAVFIFACNHGNNDQQDPDLVLKYLRIYDSEASDVSKPEVKLGKDKTQVSYKNIFAKFDYGKVADKKITTTVKYKEGSSLKEGENTITLSVEGVKGSYKAWKKDVKIILTGSIDLTLKFLTICGEEVKKDWTCEFPNKYKNVSSDDVKATFELTPGLIKVIPITVKNCPEELVAGTPTKITLIAPESKDEYNKWEKEVTVTRKVLPPQVPSSIMEFAINNDIYELEEVKKDKIFNSDVLKPVVLLATNRMFSSITSDDFDVEYPDNYKRDVKLTLKEDLQPNTPKAVVINVTTKEPNQERDDLPIKLEFSLQLEKGGIKITGVSAGNIKIQNENETINVSTTPQDVQVDFELTSVIGLTTTLEKKDGSNQKAGVVQGAIATFSSIELQEGDNEFVVKASGTNADAVQFAFKINYTQVQAENVNIEQVKLDEKPVTNGSDVNTDKSDGAIVKIYLDKEYDEAAVTINGTPATIPNAGNPKLFQGTLQGLQENVKTTITINATAKDKTASTFTFNVTYVAPAIKLITKILALGDEDTSFATLTDKGNDTFETLLTGLKLKEFKAEIADIKDKDLSKLKIELSKGSEKLDASFVQNGSVYVASISSINSPFDELQDCKITTFTLKLFYNDVLIETYTLNIKGSDQSGGGWG